MVLSKRFLLVIIMLLLVLTIFSGVAQAQARDMPIFTTVLNIPQHCLDMKASHMILWVYGPYGINKQDVPITYAGQYVSRLPLEADQYVTANVVVLVPGNQLPPGFQPQPEDFTIDGAWKSQIWHNVVQPGSVQFTLACNNLDNMK